MSIIISLACALSVAGLGNECWSIENCPLFYVGSFGDEAPTWLQVREIPVVKLLLLSDMKQAKRFPILWWLWMRFYS